MAYDPTALKPGQVILCVAPAHEPMLNRLLDDAISWSSGPFVHAGYVGDGEIIEQVGTVRTSPIEKYTARGWVYDIAGMTSAKAAAMVRWGMDRLGQPYGYRAILEDAALYDLHDWNELRAHPKFPVCSGFVERASRLGALIPITEQPLPSPTSLAFSPVLIGRRPWEAQR